MFDNIATLAHQLVGSQSIEHAATDQSDWDYLVFAWNKRLAQRYFYRQGFRCWHDGVADQKYNPYTASFRRRDKFLSMRRVVDGENINLIITSSPKFYRKFLKANRIAQILKLTKKTDRIALFQFILYNNTVS